ncbi:hypothetical protein TIFTF001_050954 [Ficus carica]|uniref:Uncharacterized protein n=1 Tax=Ficus carica TaxID=3494 RepID=A0AA87YPH9_FICCA|nr:hypothetical protein TIFTF001_050954 [Ficus carica]
MFTNVKPLGKNKTSRMLCRADLPQRRVSNLPANSDAILWRAGSADCEMTRFMYVASKLPLVVPIHISSDLVYNMIMMAFKEGLKVRYSKKLQPTDVKFNPFKVTDVNEITSQLLSTRIYVGEHQKFDYSSLFVIVQNILKGSTRIVDEIAQGGQQQYLETAGQEITPTLTNADFVVPSCKLKEILSKVPALMVYIILNAVIN